MCSGDEASFRIAVNAVAWDVSVPIIPSRRSAADAARLQTNTKMLILIRLSPRGQFADLFLYGIPRQRAALAVAVNGHAAGDGNPEPELKGAIRLVPRPHAVQKILHVDLIGVGGGAMSLGCDFHSVRPVHFQI